MRIAIVNDLSIAVEAIRRVLMADGHHQIAWIARNGAEAVQKCAEDRPDLILMDLIMPVLNGVEATRQIMVATPCPILIVTGTVDGHTEKVFEALGVGALDAIETPVLGSKDATASNALLKKIDSLEKQIGALDSSKKISMASHRHKRTAMESDQLVAIGASAGGPVALVEILSRLPEDLPAAVVLVQHVDAQFAPGLVEWMNQASKLPVRLAHENDKPEKGTVLMASTADHLVFKSAHTLGYTPHPIDYVYRPSIDVFFQSIVKHWRGRAVGVLLTGMGQDGAKGLKLLREAGHHTIAQDRATSAVYGMPKAAANLGAAVEILPLNEIEPALQRRLFTDSSERVGKL